MCTIAKNSMPIRRVLLGRVLLISLIAQHFVASTSKRTRSVKNKRQLNRKYYEIRSNCEINSPAAAADASDFSSGLQQELQLQPGGCGHLIFEESASCVTGCMSPTCHAKIYGTDPLELGEIDLGRHVQFELCAKREVKERSRIERIQKRKASAAAYEKASSP